MKLALTIIGVAFEAGGGILTFWPELVPRARRLIARLRGRFARLEARIRRLLRRPKNVTVIASAAGAAAFGGRASAYTSVPEEAPLERKLSFLLDQAVESQQRLNDIEHRLGELPAEWRKEIEATRSALEERIAQELEQQREQFIGRRLTGLGFIVTGSILLGIVNLLP